MAEKKTKRYQLVRHKWPDEIQAERNKRIRIVVTTFTCVVCFCAGFLVNNLTSAKQVTNDTAFEKLSVVYETMKDNFYFGKEKKDFSQTLINGAISGMVNAGGDRHTSYMTPAIAEQFSSSMSGSYLGIGVQFSSVDQSTFLIEKVFKNSPAEQAGVMPGDIVFAVDGKPCEGMTIDEVSEKIIGKSGTSVEVEFIRGSEHIKKVMERKPIANTVKSEIREGVALVQLETFADTSGDEFGVHLKDLPKDCKKLVLDLRNNGGGYLVAAQQISSYLLPSDSVVYQTLNRDGSKTDTKVIDDMKHYTFDKIVVLVNEDTASAAEVLTLALQENLNASVVGSKTYGKGTVQMPISFKDGSSLKYTVAKWLSPNGKSIDKKGIKPDVEVALDPAMSVSAPKLEEDEVFKSDSVNVAAQSVQTYLKFLGYPVDRCDEYFSPASSAALKAYQKDQGLEVNGEIDAKVITSLLSSSSLKWHMDVANDTQLSKALELANGN